jgi:hypothetical protein
MKEHKFKMTEHKELKKTFITKTLNKSAIYNSS